MKPTEWRGRNTGAKLIFLFVVVAVTAVSGTVMARPGTLDPSFSGDGIVITDLLAHDSGADVATGPGGTVIVAGTRNRYGGNPDFAVVRYLSDGSLDTSFGGNGIAITPFTGDGTFAAALAVQDNGKIVVTGNSGAYADTSLTVVRYTAAGTLDTTFSGDGILTAKLGSSHNWGSSLGIQKDGKILVAGTSWISDYDFVLLRLNDDGSLDSSFGVSGVVSLDLGAWDFCYAVALQGDGKIVLAGRTGTYDSGYHMALARFTSSGTLDASFGSSGTVTTGVNSPYGAIVSLALQQDGRIVGAGYSNGGLTVVRYDTTGALDNSFDGDGLAVTASCNEARDIAIQPDGRIIVVAMQVAGYNQNLAIVRYLSNGSLDRQFGSAGITVVDLGGDYDWPGGVALQGNERILVSGEAGGATGDLATLRLYGYAFSTAPSVAPIQLLLLGE